MEIVFAILILIGTVAAGSSPSTSDEGSAERDPVTESEPTSPTHRVEAKLGPCRFPDGRLIQRDLTVPRSSTVVMSKVNPEEARHDCADR